MRGKVTGEQYAQIDNPDPFASPVWRSPVYRTPEPVIWLVQLTAVPGAADLVPDPPPAGRRRRGLPGAAVAQGRLARRGRPRQRRGHRPGRVAGLAAGVVHPVDPGPIRCRWRWWFYRRHWHAVMTIAGLAPLYRGRVMLPVLGEVTLHRCTDRVTVQLVSGQVPEHFADRAEGLAHGFRAHLCRVRTAAPGMIVLELVRRDALADPIPALPIPEQTDLRALPVGRCEDGSAIHAPAARHAPADRGATGAGKRLLPVGPDPGHAPRHGRRAGPGLRVRPEADGTGVRPGHLRPVRVLRRRPRRHRRPPGSRRRRHAGPGPPVRGQPARPRPDTEHPFV